ncbi:DUF3310 domain-containing protein [Streptomyces halstedii]|uniref:DUF3310 domain-containing protein n=1 Tax=Streptomyces halstedii TaxID=1944 RepID=UPI00380A9F45
MSNFEHGDRVVVVKNNHPSQSANFLFTRGMVQYVSDFKEYEVAVLLDDQKIVTRFDSSELELEGVYDALSAKPSEDEEFNKILDEVFSDDEEVATSGSDAVNHPPHYADGWSNGAEVIDITENLNFNRGNAVKYLARAGKKGGPEKELEDLQKALWYVSREVERLGGTV